MLEIRTEKKNPDKPTKTHFDFDTMEEFLEYVELLYPKGTVHYGYVRYVKGSRNIKIEDLNYVSSGKAYSSAKVFSSEIYVYSKGQFGCLYTYHDDTIAWSIREQDLQKKTNKQNN